MPARLQTFDALSEPTYRRLWISAWFLYVARMVELVVLSWMILEITDSPSKVALVGIFRMMPMFFLGLVAGALADRLPKLSVLKAVLFINLVVASIFLVLITSGELLPWHVYIGIFITGTGWTLDFAARRSLYPELFPEAGLVNAISLDTASLTGSMMIGPLLGGGLISLSGFSGAYWTMISMYTAALLLVLTIRSGGLGLAAGATGSILSKVNEALRTIRVNRTIRAAFIVTVLLNFFGFPYIQMVPVIARDVLGVREILFGLLMSSAGLGALLGSLLIASRTISNRGAVYLFGACLMLGGLFFFAMSDIYLVSLVLLFIAGIGTAGFATMQISLALGAVPQELRGRAMGAIALAIGASPLGMLVLGQMAEVWGAPTALALLAGSGFFVLLSLWWLVPELRDHSKKSGN